MPRFPSKSNEKHNKKYDPRWLLKIAAFSIDYNSIQFHLNRLCQQIRPGCYRRAYLQKTVSLITCFADSDNRVTNKTPDIQKRRICVIFRILVWCNNWMVFIFLWNKLIHRKINTPVSFLQIVLFWQIT